MIASAKKNIKYYSKSHKEELQRCKEANKWVEDFINSLPKE